MGRQGPRLVPFLQDGMANKKYRNLINEDGTGLVFSIVLPHKTKKLEVEDEMIFKDWYALNGKKYVFHSKHYTDAKQAIMASLRKSDYVNKVHISDNKLTYRILNKAEVKEKKRLKKELKKSNELKKEAADSDDGSSSVESGYGSGAESPRNDNAEVSQSDNLVTPSDNESGYGRGANSPGSDYAEMPVNNLSIIPAGQELSPLVNTMETNSSLGITDVLLSMFSGKFDGFLKPEPMDTSFPADNSLAVPETPILFEADLFTNLQPFVENLKSEDNFPENIKQPTHCADMMDSSSAAPELCGSDFIGSLPFENEDGFLNGLSDEFLNNLLSKDVPAINSDSSLVCEYNINNQSQNGQKLNAGYENILTEDFWNGFGDFSDIDSHSTVDFKEKSEENILPSPDPGLPETEAKENIYLCKNCVRLGKIPILFCEPQFERKPTETSGEIKIAFEEAVLKDINGCKSVKEYKFINDHLLVILEPDDE